jgi:acyl CoA:acetate/3-ketoacid CoA transferase
VADGVDIHRDILDQMEFASARIPDRPKPMDHA